MLLVCLLCLPVLLGGFLARSLARSGRLAGWLAAWLAGWLAGWLAYFRCMLACCLISCLALSSYCTRQWNYRGVPLLFATPLLGPPVVPFHPFVGESSPTKIDETEKSNGTLTPNLSTGGPSLGLDIQHAMDSKRRSLESLPKPSSLAESDLQHHARLLAPCRVFPFCLVCSLLNMVHKRVPLFCWGHWVSFMTSVD